MTPAKRLAQELIEMEKAIKQRPFDLVNHQRVFELAHQILRKRPSSPAKPWKPRLDTKPARKRWKAAETAEIRTRVMERATGMSLYPLCELHEAGWNERATELAHLESGSGRRTQNQGVHNTAASCHACNMQWDHCPSWRLEMATRWSKRTGLAIPHSVIAAHALKHPESTP